MLLLQMTVGTLLTAGSRKIFDRFISQSLLLVGCKAKLEQQKKTMRLTRIAYCHSARPSLETKLELVELGNLEDSIVWWPHI